MDDLVSSDLCPCAVDTVLQLWPNKKGSQAPVTAFWSSSVSNAIGPACGIVALKYISYPAQVFASNISLCTELSGS